MIHDMRRAPRLQVRETMTVTDAMSDVPMGQVGNLSETGMLLIAHVPIGDNALYQLQFPVAGSHGSATIDVGAQVLWHGAANTPGRVWAGLRFLTVSEPHLQLLRDWIQDAPIRQR
ncbi:MAG: PilZ domain-containing protein [Pseudoxanthomonas sp.]